MGLISAFTGSGASKQLNKGIAAVQGGQSSALGAIQTGANEAKGYMTPWATRGGRKFYDDSLGLNGADARTAAQDTYFSDDVLQRQLALQQKQRGWTSNARGGYGSGADALAASRVNLENYGNWQNRLAGVAGQEFDATRGLADIASGAGSATANTYMSGANALAGLYGQKAQNANTFAQNVIGGIGAVGSFFGGGGGGGSKGGGNNLGKFFMPGNSMGTAP